MARLVDAINVRYLDKPNFDLRTALQELEPHHIPIAIDDSLIVSICIPSF